MICDKCGRNNDPAAKFCSTCGANLHEASAKGGWNRGDASVYNDGYTANDGNGYDTYGGAQDNGYPQNYGQNPNAGYRQGYGDQGYNQDYGQEYNRGYGQGYDQGYGQSYNQGYNQGYAPDYNQGYQGYSQPSRPVSRRNKTVSAMVIYIISGAIAVLCLISTVFPSLTYDPKKIPYNSKNGALLQSSVSYLRPEKTKNFTDSTVYNQNIFEYISENFNNGFNDKNFGSSYSSSSSKNKFASDGAYYVERAAMILTLFSTPMVLLTVGAILSFLRKRAAGGLMLAGSIIFTVASSVWFSFLQNTIPVIRAYFTNYTVNTGDYKADTSTVVTAAPYIMVVLGIAGIVMAAIQIKKKNQV